MAALKTFAGASRYELAQNAVYFTCTTAIRAFRTGWSLWASRPGSVADPRDGHTRAWTMSTGAGRFIFRSEGDSFEGSQRYDSCQEARFTPAKLSLWQEHGAQK
jgi:hypothetical protein